jgi:hypothetical protein
MGALRRGRHGAFAIVVASGLALVAGGLAGSAACAQVSGGSAAPASSAGAPLWVSTYSGPGAHDDLTTSVAVARDGAAVFVTGRSPSAAGTVDYATVGYNASTGAKLWASRYVGAGGAGGEAVAVAVDPAGKAVFVTGSSPGPGTGADYVTIAYNARTGQRLWLSRYNGPASASDDPSGVAVSPDGSDVLVTGTSQGGPATGGDFATVAYSAATGAQLWVSRFSGPGSAVDVATSLAVGPASGTVYVTGGSGLAYATVAYNTVTGGQRWASLGPSGRASSIAVAPLGHSVYVTGTSEHAFGTVAYNAGDGRRKWLERYNGAGRSGSRANSVATNGRDLWVTGAAGRDFATVKYGAFSFRRWASIVRSLGDSDSGARQAVVGQDAVYITGGAGDDFATVSYHLGNRFARKWLRTFPGAGTALAYNPVTGDVIVTGASSRSASRGNNYTTIAYPG